MNCTLPSCWQKSVGTGNQGSQQWFIIYLFNVFSILMFRNMLSFSTNFIKYYPLINTSYCSLKLVTQLIPFVIAAVIIIKVFTFRDAWNYLFNRVN